MQDFEGRLKIRMDGTVMDTRVEVDGKPLGGVTEIHVYINANDKGSMVATAVLTVELIDFDADVITEQTQVYTIGTVSVGDAIEAQRADLPIPFTP